MGACAGCGGMWQGSMYVVGGQAYGIDRGHVTRVGTCGRV